MSKKISELSELTPLNGEEFFAAIRNDLTWKVSLETLLSAPLSADRTVDLNGHSLEIGDTSNYKLRIVAGDTIEIYAGNKQISLPGGDIDFGDLENVTNGAHFRISNTGSGFIQFSNNLTNKYFEANYTDAFYVLGDNDGTNNGSKIHIDDTAETILLKADNGTIITFPSSDPHVAGAWWDNSGTLTRSSG